MPLSSLTNFVIFSAFIAGCGLAFSGLQIHIQPFWLLVIVPIFWLIRHEVWPAVYTQMIYFVFFILLSGLLGNYFMSINLDSKVPDLAFETLTVQGKIKDIKTKNSNTSVLMIKPTVIYPDGKTIRLESNLRLHCKVLLPQLFPAQTLEICAQLRDIRPSLVRNNFNYQEYNRRNNTYLQGYFNAEDLVIKKMPRYLQVIKDLHLAAFQRLNSGGEKESLSIITAMLIGNRTGLEEETQMIFTNSGALHILSISGLHVSLVFGFILLFIKQIFPPKRILLLMAQLGAIILIWIFAAVSGLEPPVIRAALMLTLLTIGRWFYRQGSGLDLLILVCWIMLLINPFILFQLSFQFTALAMWGLIIFYQPILNLIPASRFTLINHVRSLVAASLAAQLTILPAMAYYFGQVSVYFWLSSLLAVPLTPVLLIIGLVIILTPHWVLVQSAAEGVSQVLMGWLKFCAELPLAVIHQFKFSTLQVFTWIAIIVGIQLIMFLRNQNSRYAVILGSFVFLSVSTFMQVKNSMPEILIEYRKQQPEITLSCMNEAFRFDQKTGRLWEISDDGQLLKLVEEPFQNNWLYKQGPWCQIRNKKIGLYPPDSLKEIYPVDILIHDHPDYKGVLAQEYVLTRRLESDNPRVTWPLLDNGYKLIKF